MKLLSRFCFYFLLPVLLVNCTTSEFPTPELPGEDELTEEKQYYMKIGFGSEFGGGHIYVRKWSSVMKIFVPVKSYPHLNAELDRVIAEINTLGERTIMELVEKEREANYTIYFGDKDTYVREYEPQANDLVNDNYGLFWIYWNNSYEINRGSMYVDMDRTQGEDCQKHLLREELTQSLGLMNDSFDIPDSIFQQNPTCTTEYAEVDKLLIMYLLDPRIKAGMTRQEAVEVLKIL